MKSFLGSRVAKLVMIPFLLLVTIGGGFIGVSAANALGPHNVLCAKVNSRELFVFTNTCPTGFFRAQLTSEDIFGGVGVGATGPAGPAGPVGPAGSNNTWFRSGTLALSNLSAASQTFTIHGVPAKSALAPESPIPLTTAAGAPAGVTLTVTPLAVAAGATDRGYTVAWTSSPAALVWSFSLTIEVFGATP